MKFVASTLLLLAAPSAAKRQKSRRAKSYKSSSASADGPVSPWNGQAGAAVSGAPHEVHQYEQAKYFDEGEWECRFDNIMGAVGCLACKNPRPIGGEGLVVQIKAMYKRRNLLEKDESLNKPRDHCIWPGKGEFWSCFNSNLVIEPDTDWLGDFNDKPQWKVDGTKCSDDELKVDGLCNCLPGQMVAAM